MRKGARWRTLRFRGSCGFWLSRLTDAESAHPAELIPLSITVSTNAANDRRGIVGEFLRSVTGSLFRVHFRSQTLHCLERRCHGVWTRFGTAHFRLQPTVQVFQFRTGQRIRWQRRRFRISLVFVHESNHSTAGAILAQRLKSGLSAGELDLAFRLRRHAVARCRAISPRAHGLQNAAVAGESRTLEE